MFEVGDRDGSCGGVQVRAPKREVKEGVSRAGIPKGKQKGFHGPVIGISAPNHQLGGLD